MTRGEIRAKTRKQMGETTAAFWEDAELNTWINDAVREIAWRTKCLRKNAYMTPVDGTLEYTLSSHFSDLMAVIEAYQYNSSTEIWSRLTRITRKELDDEYEGWLSSEDGTPFRYGYDKEEDWLVLYPKPDSDNTGTNYIRMYYTYDSTDMSSDAAIPQLPLALHEAVIEGVKAVGYETRGLGERANNSRTLFTQAIGDYKVERANEPDEEIIMRNYKRS